MAEFFDNSFWDQKRPLSLVPLCGACGLYKDCDSPKMRVAGSGKRRVLIIGEMPGSHEDRLGKPMVGPSGKLLERMLKDVGVDMWRDCWLTNAIICRPTENGYNRAPEADEINHCRPNIANALLQLCPDMVIPLGRWALQSLVPLAWGKDGEVDGVERWVGWQVPCRKYNCWICPSYNPAHLLYDDNHLSELHCRRHLRAAFKNCVGRPWDTVEDPRSRVRVEMDPQKAANTVRTMMAFNKPLAFDYETTTLKPDGSASGIICASVSDGISSVSFPWLGEAVNAVGQLLRSGVPMIAANMRFEERWTRREFGHGVKNWYWDTVLGAHWLDPRRGICGLKFQSFVLCGVEDYSSHLEPYMDGKGCNSPNRLRQVDPRALMLYNGLDSLLEVWVAKRQMAAGGVKSWRGLGA